MAVLLVSAGCTTTRTYNDVEGAPVVAPQPPPAVPSAFQYLYGSGEAAALQTGVFHALTAYALDTAKRRPLDSVVLATGSPSDKPSFVPCGRKPFAVVFDVDETVLLNLGFEARAATGVAYSQSEWEQWERTGANDVAATPGATDMVADLRRAGIAVVLNSNRSAASADGTVAALKAAGLGAFRHGETLFLQGDDDQGGRKDGRRAAIAVRYCVVAMAGDQLGDFSDLFAAPMPISERRRLATDGVGALWGKGWFMLPNPVYGAALKGGPDDVFPADKRWSPAP